MPQTLHLLAASALAAAVACTAASAADVPTKPAKPAATSAAKKAAPAPRDAVPEPTPEQQKAAELVYYGNYECEFNQNVAISPNQKHLFYVDVKHGKSAWLMKPVLSQTGAVRLEDVRGETLMVQIASKSMLLNTKTGHRIVDACISPRQRDLIEAAKAAKPDTGNPVLLTGSATAAQAGASPAASK